MEVYVGRMLKSRGSTSWKKNVEENVCEVEEGERESDGEARYANQGG